MCSRPGSVRTSVGHADGGPPQQVLAALAGRDARRDSHSRLQRADGKRN